MISSALIITSCSIGQLINRKMLKIIVLLVSFFVIFNQGFRGFDISVHQRNATLSQYQCLKRLYSYAIIHGYRSLGRVNEFAPEMIKNSRIAGFTKIDIYVFLNFTQNPKQQIIDTINFIKKNGENFDRIWLDIEEKVLIFHKLKRFYGTCPQNVAFFTAAKDEIVKQGYKVGIYSSKSQWDPIMCSFDGFKQYPLWYAHYDNVQSFNNFREFGGWNLSNNQPMMKQYAGTVSNQCVNGIDLNWSPKFPTK
jgi:GH25 family lysozyme M1 (1,4-beta-N-acetylmuramidase)